MARPKLWRWRCASSCRAEVCHGIAARRAIPRRSSGFVDHRRERVLVDQHVDHCGLAARERALERTFELAGTRDLLAVGAEDARKRAEVRVLVVDREEAPAVVLVLERALVA